MSSLKNLSYSNRFANLNFRTSNEIDIPDIFYKRHKTGIEALDTFFGGHTQGLFPMLSATLHGEKGSGKTTFLIQTLSAFANNGHSVAYISNEENMFMLADKCKRLNASNVPLANLNDIDEVERKIKELNLEIVVLDSFPGLVTETVDEKESEYVLTRIREMTSDFDNPVCIIVILHATKTGTYKGSTDIVHVVDANFEVKKGDPLVYGCDNVREIIGSKNRMAATMEMAFKMEGEGYDFSDRVYPPDKQPDSEKSGIYANILSLVENDGLTFIDDVVSSFNISETIAKKCLTELENRGILSKNGTGKQAFWEKV